MATTSRRLLALVVVGVVGCAGEPDTETLTSASKPTPADDQCIGAEGMKPPAMTMADVLYVLTNRVPFYTANFPLLFTGVWTNWSHDADMRDSLAKLAVMRGVLDKFNLWDMYLSPLSPVVCPADADTVRQLDGTCNNLAKPDQGSTGVRFGRNIPPFVLNADGTVAKNPAANVDYANLMNPNPREVSRKLFKRSSFKPVPFLNLLAASWIQFEVHDWFSHGENSHTDFFHVPLSADDELSTKYGLTELMIPKSASDTTRTPTENAMLPPSYPNEVTHWWDGSQLYGSDTATADRLRTFAGGRLQVDANGLLATGADGFEDTGFRRNWWLGLALMHNLFSQEHNAIADMLHAAYPAWTDQQIFDKARMINAAVMAKIHTVDWTPAILPNKTLNVGMNANWFGLNRYFNLGLTAPPAAFRNNTSHPVLFGIVGGNRDDKGVPFTLTEEFVSVYRMHPLLPEKIEVRSLATGHTQAQIELPDARNADAYDIEQTYGLRDLLFSFGTQSPGALVLGNYPRFLQELQMGPGMVTDMGTIDILRDRERGIPRYNDFRQQLRLKRVGSLEELTSEPQLLAHLRELYGDDAGAIDRVDALVGTFAEATRPDCYGFGETLFQVFTLMASRRLQADRFYTLSYNASVYTAEGIAWVEAASMKSVLLRHYPELADSGLANVANAFYPWE